MYIPIIINSFNFITLQYWLIATNARHEILSNPSYYQNLTTNFPHYIPSPYEEQIDLDIPRTFPDDNFISKSETLVKIKNVLLAYSRRSMSIGYCQGFNHIVAKIFTITDNEVSIYIYIHINTLHRKKSFGFLLSL